MIDSFDSPPVIHDMTAGFLILEMISALQREEIPSVYLRNYENLPTAVGNDVDLLVPAGLRKTAVKILMEVADSNGWSYLGCCHFSPVALYFTDLETCETLHIDLFDRIEWHFLEFADAQAVIARRIWNGLVHIPDPTDELYLNLTTRLVYQGAIREKHRVAAREFIATHGTEPLGEAFGKHLGDAGKSLFTRLSNQDWQPQASDRGTLLSLIARSFGIHRPHRLMAGVLRYLSRTLHKIIRPPGKLIVLEGADGVGKSTILEAVRPWCSEWGAGRATYEFHWKPKKVSTGSKTAAAPVDPRGRGVRPWPISLAYLGYHIAGFWWGWLTRIFPLLTKSHAVVGDRYSYDLFLDPARFRLGLPPVICRIAALMTPRPAVTIALVADPNLIHARKPELSVDEIASYQDRWRSLSAGRSNMVTVTADGTPNEVVLAVKRAILKVIVSNGKQ